MPRSDRPTSPLSEEQHELFLKVLDGFAEQDPDELPATCACILAVDLGVPAKIAYLLLELFVAKGQMIRTDLRKVAVERRDLSHHLSDWEAVAISESPAALTVYFGRRKLSKTREMFSPLLVEMALMLRILNQVLFKDTARLKWDFQAATKALRKLGRRDTWSFPVGLLAEEALGETGRRWCRELARGDVPFERFKSNTSTQLRILMYLALEVAGGDFEVPSPWELERLEWSTPDRRAKIVQKLGRLLIEGLEVPADYRSAFSRQVVGDENLVPEDDDPWDAFEAWYAFLDRCRERLDSAVWEEVVHLSLKEIPPQDWGELPESIAHSVPSETLWETRRETFWHTALSPA